ncbi:MAG: hypothetical protein N0A16_11545 [Blastocatellia bacterium]|nr:hypothetical protein [Blastocatellia bacterium]MCS7158349.1 hypothetical protein [Blastocatellia bacterium]MCX7752855.1 hypothetical protein [Blastocatellia bacterium]MDW8167911.1 hypothetical protein [Acidobacteriota bacterium]MDW8255936.1 hypothetical protein [Acidobacteriota bacterium]
MRSSGLHPLIEIALGLLPVLVIMWVTPLLIEDRVTFWRTNFWLSVLAFSVAFVSNVTHGDGLREIGLRVDNLGRALQLLALPTGAAALGILAIGLAFESVNLGERFLFHLRTLPPWALVQQYALQGFIHRRLQDLWGKGNRTALWVATIFATLHLPNPVLVVGTFLGGYVWARTFQREPNLLALAASHTLLSALLANSLPTSLLPNMKVGWGYWGG